MKTDKHRCLTCIFKISSVCFCVHLWLQLFVKNLPELLTYLRDLRFIKPGIEKIELVFPAFEMHDPDVFAVLGAAVVVHQHLLAHEDQPQDEAEVELGRLGGVLESLEK